MGRFFLPLVPRETCLKAWPLGKHHHHREGGPCCRRAAPCEFLKETSFVSTQKAAPVLCSSALLSSHIQTNHPAGSSLPELQHLWWSCKHTARRDTSHSFIFQGRHPLEIDLQRKQGNLLPLGSAEPPLDVLSLPHSCDMKDPSYLPSCTHQITISCRLCFTCLPSSAT